MARYRKKPVIIEATQWFVNGDHPLDGDQRTDGCVVQRYQAPEGSGDQPCRHCGNMLRVHGWVTTLEGGHIVCPGDYIITGVNGEHYPCKPDIFDKSYELVED